jgi:hypothetical protein
VTTQSLQTPQIPVGFASIPTTGALVNFSGKLTDSAYGVSSHVQGIARYANRIYLTHNCASDTRGLILVLDAQSRKLISQTFTNLEGFNHPGGIQRYGGTLAVAIENADATESYVAFYDLLPTLSNPSQPPQMLPNVLSRNGVGTGAVGLTRYTSSEGESCFMIVAFNNGATDFYVSAQPPGSSLQAPTLLFSAKLANTDYQGVSLFTAPNSAGGDDVYLVGFRTADYIKNDYMDLMWVDLEHEIVSQPLASEHMTCVHGWIIGVAGVHFRYAGGLDVDDTTGGLSALAGQRNFVEDYWNMNTFAP